VLQPRERRQALVQRARVVVHPCGRQGGGGGGEAGGRGQRWRLAGRVQMVLRIRSRAGRCAVPGAEANRCPAARPQCHPQAHLPGRRALQGAPAAAWPTARNHHSRQLPQPQPAAPATVSRHRYNQPPQAQPATSRHPHAQFSRSRSCRRVSLSMVPSTSAGRQQRVSLSVSACSPPARQRSSVKGRWMVQLCTCGEGRVVVRW
jgi:hypothetical protein